MPCFNPLEAWKKADGGVTFKPHESIGLRFSLPCRQCIGCRIDYAKEWAARITHEARFHPANSFLTLTYATEHLPVGGTLVKRDLQLFFKRLRKQIAPRRIRYFAVGEYGDLSFRPHYHICLFGWDFAHDRKLWSNSRQYALYYSPSLEKLWEYGHSSIGELNPSTAAYTARYVTKKINGPRAEEHYRRVHLGTGEEYQLQPEFSVSSRRPGIGTGHFDRYRTDIYPDDFVVLNGCKSRTPRFYDKLLDRVDPALLEKVKAKRLDFAKSRAENSTPDRLAVREKVLKAKLKLKAREI